MQQPIAALHVDGLAQEGGSIHLLPSMGILFADVVQKPQLHLITYLTNLFCDS